jgi:lycopene cyclase CruP
MSVPVSNVDGSPNSQDRINDLLNVTFDCMEKLGDRVIYPFLQDVVQFLPLTQTMLAMAIANPILVLKIVREVGLFTLLDWFKHYLGLGYYSLLYQIGLQIFAKNDHLLPEQKYYWQRQLEAWQYGSGGDFTMGDRAE